MRMLLPFGVLLIVIGAGGTLAACFGNSIFEGTETPRLYLAPAEHGDPPRGIV